MAIGAPDIGSKPTVMFEQAPPRLDAPAKTAESAPCFIIIRGPRQGRQFFVKKAEIYIGRDPNADIHIPDDRLSRRHARVVCEGDEVLLFDHGSSNGTFVNGARLIPTQPATLAKEDRISVGNTILKFLPAGDLEIQTFRHMDREANTDPLTGAFNKRYLLDMLDTHCARARALNAPFALVFLDLDHFKRINDQHGHEAGDAVLKASADVIRSTVLRASDEFARYGGEEFVVLLPHTTATEACRVAERIRAAVEAHDFSLGSTTIHATISAGVAELNDAVDSGARLLAAADNALYVSKAGGRNRVTAA